MDGIVSLTGDFVDFVNENNTPFSLCHIVIGNLEQAGENALDIFADITSFGEYRRIDNGERYVEQFGNGTGQQSLASTSLSYQNDIRFVNVDFAGLLCVHQPFVMVVHRNGQISFSGILSDDILIEESFDLSRFLQRLHLNSWSAHALHTFALSEHFVSPFDTLVANLRSIAAGE